MRAALIFLALILVLMHPWLVLAAELIVIAALAAGIARAAGWRPRLILTWRLS